MWRRMCRGTLLLWVVLLLALSARAQDKGAFTVQDGAFPWYDRVNAWALASVPASLKGAGPLPRQNCSNRSLEVPGQPGSITIGVQDKDLAKFKGKFPTAHDTGDHLAVRNPAGAELPYTVLELAAPPPRIDGAGWLGAGLLLLKLDNAAAPAAPATAPPSPVAPAPPATQGTASYTVQDGAFPWYDRMTGPQVWTLDSVPDTLKGSGPLPRQSCTSRSLSVPGQPHSITLGVAQTDVAKFKTQFPTAQETGEAIAVKNPQGVRLPYRVFTLVNAPARLGAGDFGAGLLLLKVEGDRSGTALEPARPASSAGPASSAPGVLGSPTTVVPGSLAPGVTAPPAPGAQAAAAPDGSSAPAAVKPPAREVFHIYLLMGQSNMVGRDTAPVATQTVNPRVLALHGNGPWVVAREPMHAGGSGIGPGIPFALAMLQADPHITIGLVPCAVGGTPLSRWVKGGDLYEKAVLRARGAMRVGVLKGVLWHQGESDTGKKEDADSYEARLTQMFKDLREDLNAPQLPIVVGQLGDFLTPAKYPYVDTVRGAIEHAATTLPHVGLAEAVGLGDKGDSLHFSAAAQREFGARYAKAMQKLQE